MKFIKIIKKLLPMKFFKYLKLNCATCQKYDLLEKG